MVTAPASVACRQSALYYASLAAGGVSRSSSANEVIYAMVHAGIAGPEDREAYVVLHALRSAERWSAQ